jgi:iron complex transport system permease protein
MKHLSKHNSEQEESLFVDGEESLRPPSVRLDGTGQAPADSAVAPTGDAPARRPMDPRARKVVILLIVFLAVLVFALFMPHNAATIAFTPVPSVHLSSPAEFTRALQERAGQVFSALSLDADFMSYSAITTVFVVMLTGAGLSLSGAVYQGAFRNALASPSTFGVMGGALVGFGIFELWDAPADENFGGFSWGLVFDYYDPIQHLWYRFMPCVFSFVFAMLTVAIVLLVVKKSGSSRDSKVYTVVVGQLVAAVCTGIYNCIKTYYCRVDPYGSRTGVLRNAQASVFGGTLDLFALIGIAVPMVLIIIFAMRNSRKLMLLSFGDKEAQSMGIASDSLRIGAIVACTALTALIVGFCGPIGFVGFFIPHVTRKLVGPVFTYFLPAAMLMGGAFTMGVYAITAYFSNTSMAGPAISLIGAVAFFVVALQQRGSRHGDWV